MAGVKHTIERRPLRRWSTGLLTATLGGLFVACGIGRGVRVEPVLPEASRALAETRALLRTSDADDRRQARAAAQRAATLAPDWVAPLRVLDDLAREDLRAIEVLAEHLAEIDEGDRERAAAHLYLAGRLENAAGARRFEQSRRIASDLAWAHHGAAWVRFTEGDPGGALADGRRALERARDPWERSYFAIALARYLAALDRLSAALEVLEDEVPRDRLAPVDRADLDAWKARLELSSDDDAVRERGSERALRLLGDAPLAEADVARLAGGLLEQAGPFGQHLRSSTELALAGRDDRTSRRLRARLLIERGAFALGLAVAPPDMVGDGGRAFRAARLATGDATVIETWRAGLPARVKGSDGLPRDPHLRALVLAAQPLRSGARATPHEHARALGEALLAAGWFVEARGQALALASFDADAALELDRRASRGRVLLEGIARVLSRVDAGAPVARTASVADGAPALSLSRPEPRVQPVDSLAELMSAIQQLFNSYGERVEELAVSPLLHYGPVASVVHPGPAFSAADEAAGRGRTGAPVPGLASAFAAIGRFALFGQVLGGGGPDGTVLRRLWIEHRSGEHLGIAFAGTVAWCEGTDVPSRPVRHGARITGAALHEGYWIDVDGVREELERWHELERRFFEDPNTPDRAARALAVSGPSVRHAGGHPANQRIRAYAAGGEADRVRLTVLRDRRNQHNRVGADGAQPSIVLDDLLEVTAIHEEGHLCDRARFLPVSRNLLELFGFFLRAQLSPQRVAETLEYRAQLVALCSSPDPRIPLADCLDALAGGQGVTPHGAAYRRLVGDLLRQLDLDLDEYPALDSEYYLVQQLHRLGAEDVRTLARKLVR